MRYTCTIAFTGSLVGSSNPVQQSSPQSSPAIRDGHHKAIFSQLVLDLKGLIVNWAKNLVQVMLRYKLMVLMVLFNVSCAKIICHLR